MIVHLLEELSAPLSEDQVCGPDLGYDAAFMALEAAALGTPERQSGDVVVAAEPPDWPDVYDSALELAQRTRDLRLAVLLTRAGARTQGLAGYAAGLTLVSRLLERYWDSVHPRLDDGDATMRMNVLAELCDPSGGLGDLRTSYLVAARHPLTVRLIELALTPAEPLPGEARPTPAGIGKGVQDATAADAALPERLRSVHAAASGIERSLGQRVGIAGPDLGPLLNITRALDLAAAAAQGKTVDAMASDAAVGPVTERDASTPAVIRTREDVVRTLGGVCDWIERHEPSNPAPLLIRRAQRLMSKSFLDLVRDLAPDGLTQIEHIAGVAKT
ncbi:MAG TPA: type VI secretion system protein TssA [Variovorax sp.]|nr:type VI secretion system protein TssA [Variovorax sp.]